MVYGVSDLMQPTHLWVPCTTLTYRVEANDIRRIEITAPNRDMHYFMVVK